MYEKILHRAVSGNLTETEKREFETLIAVNDDLRSEYDLLMSGWEAASEYEISANFSSDSAWDKLALEIEREQSQQIEGARIMRLKSTSRLLQIAASVAVICVCAFLFFQFGAQNQSPLIVSNDGDSPLTIDLEDGSSVTLNSGAELSHSIQSDMRKASLKGEAFFEVARKDGVPFLVDMGLGSINVLGTSFNVEAEQDGFEVTVAEGKVQVKDGSGNVIGELKHGDKLAFDPQSNKVTKSRDTKLNSLAWKTGELIFSNERLARIVDHLEDHFDVDIEFKKGCLEDVRITSPLSLASMSIEDVLEVLRSAGNLRLEQSNTNETTFVFDGDVCD